MFYSLAEILVAFEDMPLYLIDGNCIRFELQPIFPDLEDFLVYSKGRAYFDLEDYPR